MSARRWLLGSLLALACNRGTAPAAPVTTPSPGDAAPTPAADEPADAGGPLVLSEPPLRLVEVAPGIHAALQPEIRRFDDCNAAIIVTDAGIAVIDAPQRVAAMQWLRAQADALAEAPRRRVLVTTHWHLDHSLGNSLWRAALQREHAAFEHFGHAGLPARLAAEGQGQLDQHRTKRAALLERGSAMKASGQLPDGTKLTPAQHVELDGELLEIRTEIDALASARLTPPEHTVEAPTPVALGSLTLELVPVRAHTEADLVVHIPEAHVLVTGDVLDEIPYGGHGRPRRWLAALQQLRKLQPTAIIPGHGGVLGPEHLDRMIALWEALLGQAMLAIQRGETPEQRWEAWSATPEHQALRASLVTDATSERAFAGFIPDALARAMADLRGDLDPPPKGR